MSLPRERLIVALDVSTASEATKIVQSVGESAGLFKVGKQLFTAIGPGVVRDLVGSGKKVFLDLKFHDIPNTIAAGVRSACDLGVSMLTVHASGGSKMLKAAVEAAASAPKPPLVLAVTILTSFTDQDVQEIGFHGKVTDQVLHLASLALASGCGGVVSSVAEVRPMRQRLGTGFAIVTPGIRPAGSSAGDQARVATPSAAITAGASHIVVGRPITAAKDPAHAAQEIIREIESAVESQEAQPVQPSPAVP
jgi:orotidine-5'-phosphate decarboxylase